MIYLTFKILLIKLFSLNNKGENLTLCLGLLVPEDVPQCSAREFLDVYASQGPTLSLSHSVSEKDGNRVLF